MRYMVVSTNIILSKGLLLKNNVNKAKVTNENDTIATLRANHNVNCTK